MLLASHRLLGKVGRSELENPENTVFLCRAKRPRSELCSIPERPVLCACWKRFFP